MKVFDFGLSVVQEVRRGNLNQKYQVKLLTLACHQLYASPSFLLSHAKLKFHADEQSGLNFLNYLV